MLDSNALHVTPIIHILLLQLEYHNIVSFAHQIAKGMKYIADMKVRNDVVSLMLQRFTVLSREELGLILISCYVVQLETFPIINL